MERHEAQFWAKWKGQVACKLCPQACVLLDGDCGKCGVRQAMDDTLYTMSWGKVIAQNVDPIEKKPLFHFWPGSRVFSIATPGCNLACGFCQNWQISQEFELPDSTVEPETVVENALGTKSHGIACTYTEPTVFFEYAEEVAKLARGQGLFNVWVSNGMINKKPIRQISKVIDAVNIDVKGSDRFYREHAGGVGLRPVLDAVEEFHRQGVWVEVTSLLIPGVNDSPEDVQAVVDFVAGLDDSIPLHFSRFHPDYHFADMKVTPLETLERAVETAREKLKYVYLGNVPGHDAEDTYCTGCGRKLIERDGLTVRWVELDGRECPVCGQELKFVGNIIKPAGDGGP